MDDRSYIDHDTLPSVGELIAASANQPAESTETDVFELALPTKAADLTLNALEATSLIGQRIGRRQVMDMVRKLLTVKELQDLAMIKETKLYKGVIVRDESGQLVTIRTWPQYCQLVEGRPVSTVDLDLLNFKNLGSEFFDALRQNGIGPGTMRGLRHLPEEIKAEAVAAAESGDKDRLLEIIDRQAARHAEKMADAAKEKAALEEAHAKEKADLENEVAKQKADCQSARDFADQTNRQIRELKEAEIRRKQGVVNDGDLARAIQELEDVVNGAGNKITASVRSAAIQVLDAHRDNLAEHGRLLVAQALGRIMSKCRILAADLEITPDEEAAEAFTNGADGDDADIWRAVHAERGTQG
jgi:hypothetical protein